MKERKCVKINVNMYDDTKFKIIDRMEKRDLINYVWTRLVILAGKVNLEGELFLSRNIAYSIETLAIEFNREVSEIELAIKTFIDLEMVEITQNKVYKVKNFAKHQNIKRSKKVQNQDNIEEVENNKEQEKSVGNQLIKNLNKNINEGTDKILESSATKSETMGTEINEKEKLYKSCKDNIYVHDDNKHNGNKVAEINSRPTIDKTTNAANNKIERSTSVSSNSYNIDIDTTKTNNTTIQKLNLNMEMCKNKDYSAGNLLTPLDNKKLKNKSKPKKTEIISEISLIDENEELITVSEGVPQIGKDEKVLYAFSF